MRRPRYLDLKCTSCDHAASRLVETNDDDTPIDPQFCDNELWGDGPAPAALGSCGGVLAQVDTVFDGYMKTITRGNSDFNERERERLEKRSSEHFFKKGGRDEAIDRERAMLKKNGMEGAGGVW